MIIVRLLGGQGNQMFQYAMGRAIAYQRKDLLKLDISEFAQNKLRKYALSHFKIQEHIATPFEMNEILEQSRSHIPRSLQTFVNRIIPYYKRPLYREQNFHYDPYVWNAPPNVIFSGYWQTERYFKQIENIIRQDFQLKDIPDELNHEMANLMQVSDSISLHVRRGDYVTNPVTHEFHGLCSPKHYQKAIQIVQDKIDNPVFFVFSDDMEWVKQNMNIPCKCYYITNNTAKKDYLDMWLMSQCKHHIIANSSFSWWGAWLGGLDDSLTIAPKKWFQDPHIETRDLLPEPWQTV